ncbi:uncharacterized protein LOC113344792 [Papaver somniferum]|uniref:uncharacterized protein LOC113344792 n=1 Tax=Papaver somniferum TaxID=3469 RepID=UPI000E704AE5|nr:uncharacterized protein LOC113344792 [Papaver somniferum]
MHLIISDVTLQVLSVADNFLNKLPSYHNLNRLCLTQKVTADKAVIILLEKAPNLVSLEFEEFDDPPDPDEEEDNNEDIGDDGGEDSHYNDAADGEDNNDNEDDGWALDMVAARCSFLNLKLVSFNKFTGKAWEMRWLKLILKNAKALETMTISRDLISYRKSENLMADISSLPRASASCVFKFSPKQR